MLSFVDALAAIDAADGMTDDATGVVMVARVMVGLVLAAAAGGCGGEAATVARPVAPVASSAAPSVPPSVSASPSADRAALQARAKAAAIAAKGLAPLGVGVGPKEDKAVAYDATAACGVRVDAQVKAAVQSCRSYTASDGRYTLHDAVTLPAFAGVEASFAYCQTTKRPDNTFVSCVAVLAKGPVVSSVWTVHGSSRTDNASGVKQVAKVAAEALL